MIVFISFWDSILTAGIGSYGFSVFLRFMNTDMGWSRAAISGFTIVRMATTMVLAPFLGRYADRRYGPQLIRRQP